MGRDEIAKKKHVNRSRADGIRRNHFTAVADHLRRLDATVVLARCLPIAPDLFGSELVANILHVSLEEWNRFLHFFLLNVNARSALFLNTLLFVLR